MLILCVERSCSSYFGLKIITKTTNLTITEITTTIAIITAITATVIIKVIE